MSSSPDIDLSVDDPVPDDLLVGPAGPSPGDGNRDRVENRDEPDDDGGLTIERPTSGSGRSRRIGAGPRSRRRPRVREVLGRLVSGPTRPTVGLDLDPIERQRAEYREPSIWVWRRIVGTAFAFIVVTLAWYLVKVPDGLVADETLPSQTQVASAFNELRSDGYAGARLVDHAAASLARLVIGTLIGATAGAIVGLAIGSAPLVRTVVDPVTSLLGMVPAVAIGPLVIIWMGPGEAGIVGAVAGTVLWVSIDAVGTVRIRDLRAMRPDIGHELTIGVRRALAAGWAAVLAVETLLAPIGLGPMLWTAQGRADIILAGIYVVGLIGLTLDLLPRTIEYLAANGGPNDRAGVRARHPAGRSIGLTAPSSVRSG